MSATRGYPPPVATMAAKLSIRLRRAFAQAEFGTINDLALREAGLRMHTFEWGGRKALNSKKHRVSFEEAATVFTDRSS